MKAVQEKCQQLMRVLLLVARELGGEAAHLGLQNVKTHSEIKKWHAGAQGKKKS